MTPNAIRTWLVRNPDSTVGQIAAGLGVSESTVSRNLEDLVGVLDYRGRHPKRYALQGYLWPERVEPPPNVGIHQRHVLAVLRRGPTTDRVLAQAVGLSRGECRKRLRALQERDVVTCEPAQAGFADRWRLR